MEKLTVTNLFNFEQPTSLIKISNLIGTFMTDNYLILATEQKILRYEMKNFKLIDTISLQNIFKQRTMIDINQNTNDQNKNKNLLKIINIVQTNDLIFVCFQKKIFDVLVLDGRKHQMKVMKWLDGHIDCITAMCLIPGILVTGSKDFTLRLWDINENCQLYNKEKRSFKTNKQLLNPKNIKIGLTGHKGAITCLEKYQTLYASGSTDKKVILWNKKNNIAQRQFQNQILQIQACQQSHQMIICQKNGKISIIQMQNIYSLALHGNNNIPSLSIARFIDSETNYPIISIKELDDSFVVYSDGQFIYFCQINLGKVLRKVQMNSIIQVLALGKVLIIGSYNNGVQLIKF